MFLVRDCLSVLEMGKCLEKIKSLTDLVLLPSVEGGKQNQITPETDTS